MTRGWNVYIQVTVAQDGGAGEAGGAKKVKRCLLCLDGGELKTVGGLSAKRWGKEVEKKKKMWAQSQRNKDQY